MVGILIHILLVVVLPPLLLGVIVKTKAVFAGRVGAPVLQPYYDLIKLWSKETLLSGTTTWIFWVGPAVALAATGVAAFLVPLAGEAAHFPMAARRSEQSQLSGQAVAACNILRPQN